MNGIMWKRYKLENAIYERANFRIVLVDGSSSKDLRGRAMKFGSLANEETNLMVGFTIKTSGR